MIHFNKTPLFQFLYPSLTWKVKTGERNIYLTFDDGPIPTVTDFVLETLQAYNAKATFFCVGENIKKHPDVFGRIIRDGHSVGNHTYNHLNGWRSDDAAYFANVQKCEDAINENSPQGNTRLLRPPYGRIKRSQIKLLRKRYKIIMWDVLTKDYDPKLSMQQCLNYSVQVSTPGSIVVFHDSIKTESKLKFVLPEYLKYFSEAGFRFLSL